MSENTVDRIVTLSSYPKAIAHIDCDAFFASCEQARDPRLRGRPVVTGKERGIISCASYEAKALGIKRGVRLFEAKARCPGLVVLPSDYETYSLYSERMFAIIRRFSPLVEEFSIDEAFCDLTGLRRMYRSSYQGIAEIIKETIQKELDITVSVGLSLTKTLAKICSKYRKPDGFTAVPGRRVHEFLKGMPLERVCGFGENTTALLMKYGVRDVLEYAQKPPGFVKQLLGKIGFELWHELRGNSVYPVTGEAKERYLSISKTKTFVPASDEREYVYAQLLRNLESACIKLRRYALSCATVMVYLRTHDFSDTALSARLNRHTASTIDFTGVCANLFAIIFKPGVRYRATGIILSDIVSARIDDRTLFDDPVKIEKITRLYRAVDAINQRYGKHAVHLAASNAVSQARSPCARNDIAPRKKELLKGETLRKRLNMPLLKLC